ncbi:MAG: iron chelate uptake ABC transporter family permease subunit [Actinomycetota bacterium]
MSPIFALSAPSTGVLLAVVLGLLLAGALIQFSPRIPEREVLVRRGSVSTIVQMRVVWLAIVLLGAWVTLLITGLIVGDFPITAGDALGAAFWDRGADSTHDFIVNTLRFPRVMVALLAGVALASSGAIFQGLIGNPLMSPDIVGINQGAAVCAVWILVVGGNINLLPIAAFAGALTTAGLIYVLSWRRGVSSARLILVGVGINSLLGALISYMLVRYPIERVSGAARWSAGTLFGSSWEDVRNLVIGLVILLPAAFILTRRLRVLQLGDDTAAALGVTVERDRLLLLAVGSGLAAIAVAVVGPLGFVALLVPHMARLLAGPLTGGVLLLSTLLGGVMLLGSDLIAQRMFAPTVLPAGVVTAALGGPYFLMLLYKYNRAV